MSGKTFVLVHGGWHGGWCWRDVARLLREAGHDVHTPTLTGLGERAHLLTRGTDLELHVRDVLATLAYEDLTAVTLVGHSYAGMVVTGVADRAPERLAHVVYLDAFVPEDGESLFDLLPQARREMYLASANDGLVPPPPAAALGVTDPAQARRLDRRLDPQPLATFTQPSRRTSTATTSSTYIHCTEGPAAPSFAPFARRAQERGWPTHTLATGHDAMLTLPEETAELLKGT